MYLRMSIVLCFALCTIAGFSGAPGFDVQEASAAAENSQEVVDAWDALCINYNFDECPADVLSGLCTTTVGDLYFGGNFGSDIDGLLDAMKDELDLILCPEPPINNDLISVVVEDEIWLQE